MLMMAAGARADEDAAYLAPLVVFFQPPSTGVVGKEQAQAVWPRLQQRIPAGHRAGVLFVHLYTTEEADLTSAEWDFAGIGGDGPGKTAILLRFRFQDLALIGTWQVAIGGKPEFDMEQAAAAFRNTPLYRDVEPETAKTAEVNGFYVWVAQATDFGGTQVLTRQGGQRIFAATTIAGGEGKLLFPPASN
jgi:hypothetical protein